MIIERYIQWKTHKNIHFWDKIRYARLLEANSSISSHLSWYEANYIGLYLLFLIFYIPCNLPAQKFCILHFWTFILKVSLLLYYCVLLFVTIYCLESRFRNVTTIGLCFAWEARLRLAQMVTGCGSGGWVYPFLLLSIVNDVTNFTVSDFMNDRVWARFFSIL